MDTTDTAEAPADARHQPAEPLKLASLPIMEPEEWRLQYAGQVFRSNESLRYFIRQHRDELIEAGAIVAPIGRQMINPQAFEAAVLRIGQRLARSLRR